VAEEFSGEVVDRSENAASDDLAFQSSEPDLDLLEPGRIGGREGKLEVGVSLQKLFDLVGLVCRQII